MLLKSYLACFWCLSALPGTSVPPAVLRKGLGLLVVEAQILRPATAGSWGALEWGRVREGIRDGGLSLALRQLVNKFRPRAEFSCLGHQWVRAQLVGQQERGSRHPAFLETHLAYDTLLALWCGVSSGKETGKDLFLLWQPVITQVLPSPSPQPHSGWHPAPGKWSVASQPNDRDSPRHRPVLLQPQCVSNQTPIKSKS